MYSLIVVDYNSIEATMDYIERCRQYLGAAGASHVVIVENGKEADVIEALGERYGDSCIRHLPEIARDVYCFQTEGQEIIYCASDGNLGYARGNNLGVKIADAVWNDPFYIISNNDLVFNEVLDLSLIDSLFHQNARIGVIGPLVVTPTGEQQSPRGWLPASHRLLKNYWISALGGIWGNKQRLHLWNKYCNDTVQDAQSGYCDWISGCFMFVRADAFHKANLFDEYTFLYAEEPILAKRLESAGSRVYFCREVEVIHKHAESTKKAFTAFQMVEIDFNSNYYFYKTYTDTNKLTLLFCKAGFYLYKFLYMIKHRIREILQNKR